jgi:Domain of unknown function (DUF6468)
MNEILLKIILDVMVALLLAATIFYCRKLNFRIKLLQDSKSELGVLIRQFDEATQMAVASIQEIHRASRKIGENIQGKLDKANYLANDLEFMIERANKTADKIAKNISDDRGAGFGEAKPNLNAERAVNNQRNFAAKDFNEKPVTSDKKGIEAMMDRISELKNNKSDDRQSPIKPMARLRSKAEQDLMQALKKDK